MRRCVSSTGSKISNLTEYGDNERLREVEEEEKRTAKLESAATSKRTLRGGKVERRDEGEPSISSPI